MAVVVGLFGLLPTGAREGGRGRLFNCLGTTFRRWSLVCSPSFRLGSLGRSSSVSLWCCVSQWEEMKTSLVLIHQLCKNLLAELAQAFATLWCCLPLYSAGTLKTEGKGNLSGLTLNTSSTDNVLLTQVSRLPSCVSG